MSSLAVVYVYLVYLLLHVQPSDIVSEQLQLLIVKVSIFHRPERRQCSLAANLRSGHQSKQAT